MSNASTITLTFTSFASTSFLPRVDSIFPTEKSHKTQKRAALQMACRFKRKLESGEDKALAATKAECLGYKKIDTTHGSAKHARSSYNETCSKQQSLWNSMCYARLCSGQVSSSSPVSPERGEGFPILDRKPRLRCRSRRSSPHHLRNPDTKSSIFEYR